MRAGKGWSRPDTNGIQPPHDRENCDVHPPAGRSQQPTQRRRSQTAITAVDEMPAYAIRTSCGGTPPSTLEIMNGNPMPRSMTNPTSKAASFPSTISAARSRICWSVLVISSSGSSNRGRGSRREQQQQCRVGSHKDTTARDLRHHFAIHPFRPPRNTMTQSSQHDDQKDRRKPCSTGLQPPRRVAIVISPAKNRQAEQRSHSPDRPRIPGFRFILPQSTRRGPVTSPIRSQR